MWWSPPGDAGAVAALADYTPSLSGDRDDPDRVARLLQAAQVDRRAQAPVAPADLDPLAVDVDLRRAQPLAVRREQADLEAAPARALARRRQPHAVVDPAL